MLFQFHSQDNELHLLPQSRFRDVGLSERSHLQEWIAKNPDVFDEELLIIQKEFGHFDETRERLDLLAIDKTGRLVLIENKLDDSGRDVVWQSLRYVSYCANLSKQEIVTIYQSYLDSQNHGEMASDNICDFLQVEDLNDISINSHNNQRIILVAGRFCKEVTSTALWLISKGIQIQCFKVTPYQTMGTTLIMFQQIIPPPEASDYMIKMATKEIEDEETKKTRSARETLRLEFWTELLAEFQAQNIDLYSTISPSTNHWLSRSTGVACCSYYLIFTTKEIRVELFLARPLARENKYLFDELAKNKGAIETHFGHPLTWLRLNEKKASRITYAYPCDL